MESSFLDNKLPKVVSFVATKSNSGKTTLIEALIKVFKHKGYKLGVLKHDAHKFEIDKEGKDSYRFAAAGADSVIISSKEKLAMIQKVEEEKSIEEILPLFSGVDLVIIEGFKGNKYPKIEVHRGCVDKEVLYGRQGFEKSSFLAMASDEEIEVEIPVLNINDVEKIAAFIEEKILTV